MSEPRRVLRWSVPVDDQWHHFEFPGEIVHVACRAVDTVEFWTTGAVETRAVHTGLGELVEPRRYLPLPGEDRRVFEFRVFGTGHPVTDGAYVGTALAPPDGALVWHLFAREVPRG